MKVFSEHKETYGRAYGIWVIIANAYFLLLGAAWFAEVLHVAGTFSYTAFFMMAVFFLQLMYRHKLLNTILGILALFFSLWQFIEVITLYPHISQGRGLYRNVFIGEFFVFLTAIVLSIVLVFSYLAAFKKNESY
ncbi:MAG: hypothetical protein H0X33_09350 [Taibaiella sp.]|nr:hypothetical protein [Taibaiella sp.]